MPKGHLFPTDQRWFDFLSAQPQLDEVNFWLPNLWGGRFGILSPGEPLFFKLKAPHNHIGGFGRFASYTEMSIENAWQTFGSKNGAFSQEVMRESIHRLRREGRDGSSNLQIGCIVLVEPSFWPPELWIPAPPDYKVNAVRGSGYDLDSGHGAAIRTQAVSRWGTVTREPEQETPVRRIIPGGYGDPFLRRVRLGQGALRTVLLNEYGHQCAITYERAVPVLQAAHIRPFSVTQGHSVDDAVLLRSDLHALFDRGYITITPEFRVQVSPLLSQHYGDESSYLRLNGAPVRIPQNAASQPSRAALEWHNKNRFLTA
jgi:putative restriction endonuclease